MAFQYYFKVKFKDGKLVDFHSESPNKAIADLHSMGYGTAAIARIEAKESGKDGQWALVYPRAR